MDTAGLADNFAADLVAHRNMLAGKAPDAQVAQASFTAAGTSIMDQHDTHTKATTALMDDWKAKGTEAFEHTADRFGRGLKTTSSAATEAAGVVGDVTGMLTARHDAAYRLVDEYRGRAASILNGGLAATGTGSQAALVSAVAQVRDLATGYAKESGGNLKGARTDLHGATAKLRTLQKQVEHDGVGDVRSGHAQAAKNHTPKGGKDRGGDSTRKSSADKGSAKGTNKKAHDILKAARSQLGYHEGANNANKYGPSAAWCSSFATWVWKKAGVDIKTLPFSGDVYDWGKAHGTAYGKNSLHDARPGDVLIFGTGPQNTSTSTHIGIVEKVDGNKVTMIEGNSSDRVQRVTHTLSSSTFYGGVHPK